jgi:hypothetical protein
MVTGRPFTLIIHIMELGAMKLLTQYSGERGVMSKMQFISAVLLPAALLPSQTGRRFPRPTYENNANNLTKFFYSFFLFSFTAVKRKKRFQRDGSHQCQQPKENLAIPFSYPSPP